MGFAAFIAFIDNGTIVPAAAVDDGIDDLNVFRRNRLSETADIFT